MRAVGTPYGLNLIALEGHLQLVAVLHHIAGEGHGEVVTQPFLTNLRGELHAVALADKIGVGSAQKISGIENLEEKFVALLSVFSHKGREIFHRRSLDGVVAIKAEHIADGVENVVAFRHLGRRKITGPFWYQRFHCFFPV